MTFWHTLTGITRFGIELSRSALGFGERMVPWPLSVVPRVLRLPLDVAADVAALAAGSPTSHAPHDAGRSRAPHAPRSRHRAPDRGTIAGAASDGAARANVLAAAVQRAAHRDDRRLPQ